MSLSTDYMYKKFSCLGCKKLFTTNNYKNHVNSKSCNMNIAVPYLVCIYCNTKHDSKKGVSYHELYCIKNPNKKYHTPWNLGLTANTNSSIVKQTITRKERINSGEIKPYAHIWTDEEKKAQQLRMSDIAAKSDSYSGRYNRGSVKELTCSNGFKVLGSWEMIFVEYCIKNNIQIEQPTKPFSYTYEQRIRNYYPDFYLPETDLYVEIKGYETEKDRAKWDDLRNLHKKKLLVIKKNEIALIQKDSYIIS